MAGKDEGGFPEDRAQQLKGGLSRMTTGGGIFRRSKEPRWEPNHGAIRSDRSGAT